MINIQTKTACKFLKVRQSKSWTKLIHVAFLLMLTTTSVFAQQSVTGNVKDVSGEPIIGASVVEKGTTNGVITDMDGNFILSVKPSATLVVSYIGYITQEFAIQPGRSAAITLREDLQTLDEVVVVGYGVQKRKDVTGAVASVSEKDYADLAITDITQALAGRVPGLDITSKGSNPGDAGSIVMRGHRSFVASNDPLIILDGMTFYGSMNDINPDDVKSIDVLKDASSTAIYGSKGANGVIIITTKRGDVGSPKFMLESQVGVQVAHKMPLMNAEQWVGRMYEGARTTGLTGDALESYVQKRLGNNEWDYYQNGGSTDWQDLLLQTGFRHKHQLSVSGGTERVKYNISGNILSHEGVIPSRMLNRYSIRPNIDIDLTKNLKIGMSTLLTYNNRHSDVSDEAYTDSRMLPPTAYPYDKDGNLIIRASNTATWYKNALTEVKTEAYRWENKTYSAYVNFYADWKILPSLNYRLNLSADVISNTEKQAALSESNARHGDGDLASIYNKHSNRESIENILTYDKILGKKHHFTLTGVHAFQQSHMEDNKTVVTQIPYFPALWNNIGAAAAVKEYASDLEEWKLLSFAGRLFYSYDEKYLLTASIRADGASQFAPKHKWGYFPSVALAWRLSEESFMQGTSDWLSNLKLRLNYGVSGNQGIKPYQTQGNLTTTKYSFGDQEGLGMRPGELANQDLKWEKTAVYNIGLDFGFFNNRIAGNIELYNSKTTDLLMYRNLPITTGFEKTLQNVGSTQNKGIELALQTQNIVNKNFSWNTNLSFYLNREEIVELYNGKVDDVGSKWFIGSPITVYYDYNWIGIWQTEEAAEAAKYDRVPGQIKTEDRDKSETVNDADRTILGSSQPDFVLNMVNSFRYRNWDLSFEMYTRWGHMINAGILSQEATTNGNGLKMNYWTPENPTNDYPRPDEGAQGYQQGSVLSYRDGSFIRLKNLTVGYTLPQSFVKKLHLSRVRLYLTGENMYNWSKDNLDKYNFDLETGSAFPTISSYTFGLNVTF